MSLTDAKLLKLAANWRAWARTFTQKAQDSDNVRDICLLPDMGLSLNFAARALCWIADVEFNDGATVATPEASLPRLGADIQLAHDAKGPQP